MTPLHDILISGKAQNHSLNVTTGEALSMAGYFAMLLQETPCRIEGIYINTTEQGASPSQMIPIGDVQPPPPLEMKFFYQVRVDSPILMAPYYWSTSQFYALIKSSGLEYATRFFLTEAIPNFSQGNYILVPKTYTAIQEFLTGVFTSVEEEVAAS